MTNFEISINCFVSNNPIPNIHLAAQFQLWVKFEATSDKETCFPMIKSIFFRFISELKSLQNFREPEKPCLSSGPESLEMQLKNSAST